MKKINYVFILLFFLVSVAGNSQVRTFGHIKGIVQDQNRNPSEGSIVSLLKAVDLSLIKTVFTETDGRFEFFLLESDSFKIIINQPGFKNYTSPTHHINTKDSVLNLSPIQLEAEAKNLQEVSITTKVPFVERKIDRTIINPEALISNAGGNAMDVLSKSPGIMVDENGNIKLKGKGGVMILIDDKPTYLSGSALEGFLKSLPAASIKHIEIMTNPPAHYEAAGNAGIINIKTKKNKLKGFNGNLSTNYAQGRYPRSNQNLGLNYTNKKISVFSNLSYGVFNGFHDLTIQRKYKNEDGTIKSVFDQNTYIKPSSQSYNARLGLDYYLSDRTTLGISSRGMFDASRVSSFNKANFINGDGTLNSLVIADNYETTDFKNGSLNLNFRHTFDSTGKMLTADLDYVAYATTINQSYKNDVYLPDGTNTYKDVQNGILPSEINIYAFKVDYTHPLKKDAKFDAGLKTSYTQTDNDAVYTITQDNVTQNNYNLSNHFKYDEMINAAYANYAKGFKRMDLQVGLRFESTQLDGRQLGNILKPASEFNRMYNSLFPTLFWSYKLDTASNNVITFSFGRRINRPFYQDLNPFIRPLDKYTFYEGNPYLRPTFAHNLSLAYGYKSLFTTTFSYNNTMNQIQETIEINNGIYYSRPGNIGSSVQYNLSLEASLPVKKWLTTTIYSEVQYAEYKSKLYTETLNAKGTYWYINVNNSFTFKKGWSAELSGEYITNFIDSQFSFGDFGDMTIGLQKKVFSDKGSLKFSLSDVLYTNRIRGRINNLYLTDANWFGPRDTRVASVTFSYRFGKMTNNKPKHTGSGSDTEQGRVKK